MFCRVYGDDDNLDIELDISACQHWANQTQNQALHVGIALLQAKGTHWFCPVLNAGSF